MLHSRVVWDHEQLRDAVVFFRNDDVDDMDTSVEYSTSPTSQHDVELGPARGYTSQGRSVQYSTSPTKSPHHVEQDPNVTHPEHLGSTVQIGE